jgi:2-hydroxychromene-2-carboxylate isomerase
VLPARVALLGAEQPWIGEFSRKVMELNFVLDEDINQPHRIGELLVAMDLPASELIDRAQAEPNKTRLRDQTEQARTRGVFGAPTFFVGTEMYWGDDRLEDALTFASDQRERRMEQPATDRPTGT